MWLITSLIAAMGATVLAIYFKARHKTGYVSLMLWGGTIMITIDHLISYEGGQFLERKTSGLVPSATVLGLLMLIPILLFWIILIFRSRGSRSGEIVSK